MESSFLFPVELLQAVIRENRGSRYGTRSVSWINYLGFLSPHRRFLFFCMCVRPGAKSSPWWWERNHCTPSNAWETVYTSIGSGPRWGNSRMTISGYKQLIFTDWTWFPIISKNSFWYNLYIVNLWRNRMIFFRLWVTVLGKWYVFRCFRACIRPFRVSWSLFLILHRLSSFRICSPDLHAFIVFSMSSAVTFFPGKLSISLRSCSKVRFTWPMCLCTLLSQRSISAWSKSTESNPRHVCSSNATTGTRGKGSPSVRTLGITFDFICLEGGLSDVRYFWELR